MKKYSRLIVSSVYTIVTCTFYVWAGMNGANDSNILNTIRHLLVISASVIFLKLYWKEVFRWKIVRSLFTILMPLGKTTAISAYLVLSLFFAMLTLLIYTNYHPLNFVGVVFTFLCIALISVKLSYSVGSIPRFYGLGVLLAGALLSIGSYGFIYSKLSIIDGANPVSDFGTCIYFSVVTWTTLGYGDIKPSEVARPFAASEAMLGYIYMGILVGLLVLDLQHKTDDEEP